MAKQLQVRRGTRQANNLFTGAEGEITMDTTTKSLRVHDGTTPGGFMIDTVVAFQAPSAGNGTWYRKYASGWVEQGGEMADGATVTLPVTMADTNYYVAVTPLGTGAVASISVGGKTTTGFTAGNSQSWNMCWEVKGMAA